MRSSSVGISRRWARSWTARVLTLRLVRRQVAAKGGAYDRRRDRSICKSPKAADIAAQWRTLRPPFRCVANLRRHTHCLCGRMDARENATQ